MTIESTSKNSQIIASLPLHVFQHGERRMDGESYLLGGYAICHRIKLAGVGYLKMEELAAIWQPDRLKGISVPPKYGLPYLTATQVFDTCPTPRKWLSPSHIKELSKLLARAGLILVTRSGNVGDSTLVYDSLLNTIVSDDLIRLECTDSSNIGYLYFFLKTKIAQLMIRSSKYGSIIKHLETEHIRQIPVPLIADEIRSQLQSEFEKVLSLRNKAYKLRKIAEELYGSNFEPMEESDSTIGYSTNSSEMFRHKRRLDAYHYNPNCKSAINALRHSKKELVALEELTDRIFGVPRFKHIYTEKGIPYIDSEDIFKINPELSKFIPYSQKRDASQYYVKRGWLLMACSGQIYGLNGRVVLANECHEEKILSNHIIRILPNKNKIRSGYLQMVLGHPLFGRPMILRYAFGTEVPEISPDDLGDIPIPRLGIHEEATIADNIESANMLSLQADVIENHTVELFERHIYNNYKINSI